MLVLSRKLDQEIVINENITIRVLQVKGNTVRLGVEAPRDIKIMRGELDSHDSDTGSADPATKFDRSLSPKSETQPRNQDRQDILSFPQRGQVDPSPEDPAPDHYAVCYRSPRPISLQHNRLKELVKELTRPR